MEIKTSAYDMVAHLTLAHTLNTIQPYIELGERFMNDANFARTIGDDELETIITRHHEANKVLDNIMTGNLFTMNNVAIA